jgi:hypothetical protein
VQPVRLIVRPWLYGGLAARVAPALQKVKEL